MTWNCPDLLRNFTMQPCVLCTMCAHCSNRAGAHQLKSSFRGHTVPVDLSFARIMSCHWESSDACYQPACYLVLCWKDQNA